MYVLTGEDVVPVGGALVVAPLRGDVRGKTGKKGMKRQGRLPSVGSAKGVLGAVVDGVKAGVILRRKPAGRRMPNFTIRNDQPCFPCAALCIAVVLAVHAKDLHPVFPQPVTHLSLTFTPRPPPRRRSAPPRRVPYTVTVFGSRNTLATPPHYTIEPRPQPQPPTRRLFIKSRAVPLKERAA